jgi:arylsulfatase
MLYGKWWGEKLWAMIPAISIVGQFLQTFKEYPPSQSSGSFGVEDALRALEAGTSGGGK